MAFVVTDLFAPGAAGFDTIIDVRSPAEYAEDHVPGAISLPVLSDSERAEVGTIYTQTSPFDARKLGAALVAQNAAAHLRGPLADKPGGWRPLVYCWRGGQRSGSFAAILEQIGWRVSLLEGGYQSYRRAVVHALYETDVLSPVILLDGNTGTGKTEILKALAARGHQIVDLEDLASHRGSVLGGMGAQPAQKGFETRLAQALSALDPSKPVIVEAESSRIGAINLPPRLFQAMKDAPRITVQAPVAARAAFLARTYADGRVEANDFAERLDRLVKLCGRARVEEWKEMIVAQQFEDVAAALIMAHYDPRYAKARERLAPRELGRVTVAQLDAEGLSGATDQVEAILTSAQARLTPAAP